MKAQKQKQPSTEVITETKAETPVDPNTMKIKLGQLIVSQAAYKILLEQSLPIATAFRLKKLTKETSEILKDYEASRLELCERLGTVNEETNNYEFPNAEAKQEFGDGLNALMREDVLLNSKRLHLSDLGSINLPTITILELDWLFADE